MASARLRDALVAKGVLELSPQDMGGDEAMPDTLNGNRAFAERWRDVWIVLHSRGACGLGHISARLESDGSVNVRKRMDFPLESPFGDRLESAEARLWFETDLVLTNAEDFSWRTFRSAEGATPKAAAIMEKEGMAYDEDVVFMSTQTGGLSIDAKRGEPTLHFNEEGDGPIVPDALMELYACTRPRDRESNWPVRMLGFGRDLAGRHWGVMPLVGRYAGRKGPPTGLSHAYEIRLPDPTGRSFSIWTEDEATARAFIAAQRP